MGERGWMSIGMLLELLSWCSEEASAAEGAAEREEAAAEEDGETREEDAAAG